MLPCAELPIERMACITLFGQRSAACSRPKMPGDEIELRPPKSAPEIRKRFRK